MRHVMITRTIYVRMVARNADDEAARNAVVMRAVQHGMSARNAHGLRRRNDYDGGSTECGCHGVRAVGSHVQHKMYISGRDQ